MHSIHEEYPSALSCMDKCRKALPEHYPKWNLNIGSHDVIVINIVMQEIPPWWTEISCMYVKHTPTEAYTTFYVIYLT